MTFSPVTLKGWAAIIPWARTGILFCKISTSLKIETHSVTISASLWKSNYSTLLLDGSSYLTNHSIITSFFFLSNHCLLTDQIAKIILVDTSVHPSDKPVDLLFPVSSISTFYKMGGLFLHSTSWRRHEGATGSCWLLWTAFQLHRSH